MAGKLTLVDFERVPDAREVNNFGIRVVVPEVGEALSLTVLLKKMITEAYH